MRMTRQRKILLDIISKAGMPLSAEEIMNRAHAFDASLALSTVYRNLEKMLELDLCQQTRFQDGLARYERTSQVHHHYLICTECNQRQVIHACPLHQIQHEIESATGYSITDHQINLYGLCPACQKKASHT